MSTAEPVKLLLSYDIPPERQASYYSFATGEFVPQVNALGLELAEVWDTAFGEYPQRLIVFVAPSMQAANEALNSDRYKQLEKKLRHFVENFDCRIVVYQSHFQF